MMRQHTKCPETWGKLIRLLFLAAALTLVSGCGGSQSTNTNSDYLLFVVEEPAMEGGSLNALDLLNETISTVATNVLSDLPTVLPNTTDQVFSQGKGSASVVVRVDVTNGEMAVLTNGTGPALDGEGKLAYCSEDGEQILVSSLDRPDESQTIANFGCPRGCPDLAWSLDGQLALIDLPSGEPGEPAILHLQIFSDGVVRKSFPLSKDIQGAGEVTWSADSTLIAYETSGGVHVVSVSDGHEVFSADGERPRFSPTQPNQLALVNREASEVIIYEDGEPIAARKIASPDSAFAWGPTGDELAVDLINRLGIWRWRSDELLSWTY